MSGREQSLHESINTKSASVYFIKKHKHYRYNSTYTRWNKEIMEQHRVIFKFITHRKIRTINDVMYKKCLYGIK
jgi:lysine/ornithine N-monooxygenase